MKISNSFVIKLVVVTILFKIASECGAAEHCIPSNYNVNPENVVTATGFTPDEAWKNFHVQLPQIGVLQNVKLKNRRYRLGESFTESTSISKSIFANFDYITKFQCKKGMNYMISGIVPRKTINYIPEKYIEISEAKEEINKYLNFSQAKKLCGEKSYHLVTANQSFRFKKSKSDIIAVNKTIGMTRIIVFCGYNWEVKITNWHSFGPDMIQNTWTHVFQSLKEDKVITYNKEMHLQMISNAIKGE